MAELSPLDMQLLDELFGLSSGYVLDFSDTTYAEFFRFYLRLDIDDPKYRTGGTSKAKRLRRLLAIEADKLVAEALRCLWQYRMENRRTAFASVSPDDVRAFDALLIRLGGKPIGNPQVRHVDTSETKQVSVEVYAELNELFVALLPMAPRPRGYAFEKFLAKSFEAFGLNPRNSFRNRGEQIDGSFQLDGQTYLLEAKWHGPRIGAEELHAFCGKINQKAAWSRGLFISESGFTQEGLDAFGKSKPVICMDGLDLHDALSRRLSLEEVLRRKARRAAESGAVFVAVRDLF